jgi:hypothetical protein
MPSQKKSVLKKFGTAVGRLIFQIVVGHDSFSKSGEGVQGLTHDELQNCLHVKMQSTIR